MNDELKANPNVYRDVARGCLSNYRVYAGAYATRIWKSKLFGLVFLGMFINGDVFGQVFLESSYVATSSYRDDMNTRTCGKGDFKDVGLFMQIQVYMKTNESDGMTAWTITLRGTYASILITTGVSATREAYFQ